MYLVLNLKVPCKARSTRTSKEGGEEGDDPVLVSESPELLNSSS